MPFSRKAAFARTTLVIAIGCVAPALEARTGPTWASLPTATTITIAGDPPKDIPAKERVEGLWVVQANGERRKHLRENGVDQVSVLVDAEQAKEAERNGYPSDDGTLGRCVTATDGHSARERDWQGFLTSNTTVSRTRSDAKNRAGRGSSMSLPWVAHVERLIVIGPDKAELRITEAFVDAATGGAREAGKSSLALTRLGSGPSGMVVWGAREGSRLHVVVTAPTPSDKLIAVAPFARGASRRLSSQSPAGNRFAQSDCGHLRLFLDAVPGDGDTVEIGASLLTLPDDFDPDDATMRGQVQPQTRPVTIAVSITQLSSDKEPVVSVASNVGKPGARQL